MFLYLLRRITKGSPVLIRCLSDILSLITLYQNWINKISNVPTCRRSGGNRPPVSSADCWRLFGQKNPEGETITNERSPIEGKATSSAGARENTTRERKKIYSTARKWNTPFYILHWGNIYMPRKIRSRRIWNTYKDRKREVFFLFFFGYRYDVNDIRMTERDVLWRWSMWSYRSDSANEQVKIGEIYR